MKRVKEGFRKILQELKVAQNSIATILVKTKHFYDLSSKS